MPAIQTDGLRKVYTLSAPKRRGPTPQTPYGSNGGSAPPPRSGGSPRELVALHGLNLEVRRGEFFGLLGPNGAGKTTTIGILTTRVLASAGSAAVAAAAQSRPGARRAGEPRVPCRLLRHRARGVGAARAAIARPAWHR